MSRPVMMVSKSTQTPPSAFRIANYTDKPYQPLNGAMMHFHRDSPYLCEMLHSMASSPVIGCRGDKRVRR
jgi:hypothetical protein